MLSNELTQLKVYCDDQKQYVPGNVPKSTEFQLVNAKTKQIWLNKLVLWLA